MDDHNQMSSCYSSPGYYLPLDSKEPKREKRKYRCRKRSPAAIERAKVVRRDKANARERRRMNSLNDALEELRTILPQLPDEPKMTKIETLRVAQWYIKMMSDMLTSQEPCEQDNRAPAHCHSSLPDLQELQSLHHYYPQYSTNQNEHFDA